MWLEQFFGGMAYKNFTEFFSNYSQPQLHFNIIWEFGCSLSKSETLILKKFKSLLLNSGFRYIKFRNKGLYNAQLPFIKARFYNAKYIEIFQKYVFSMTPCNTKQESLYVYIAFSQFNQFIINTCFLKMKLFYLNRAQSAFPCSNLKKETSEQLAKLGIGLIALSIIIHQQK